MRERTRGTGNLATATFCSGLDMKASKLCQLVSPHSHIHTSTHIQQLMTMCAEGSSLMQCWGLLVFMEQQTLSVNSETTADPVSKPAACVCRGNFFLCMCCMYACVFDAAYILSLWWLLPLLIERPGCYTILCISDQSTSCGLILKTQTDAVWIWNFMYFCWWCLTCTKRLTKTPENCKLLSFSTVEVLFKVIFVHATHSVYVHFD